MDGTLAGLRWAGAVRKDYNNGMFGTFRNSRRFVVSGFVSGLASVLLMAALAVAGTAYGQDSPKRGRKYKAPPPTAKIEVTVLRATNGKPVENASVIFHPLTDGRNDGNMELKTNEDGKAVMELLAVGSNVRLQILAPGFQTYGEDYKVDKDNLAIEVKLKRPAEQYSIYKKHDGEAADKPDATPKDAAAPAEKKPDASPDTPRDAPKDEAKPQDSTPKL